MQRLDHRRAALLTAFFAAISLIVVHGSQWLLDLVPCGLCLLERWPWRATFVLGILAALLPRPAGRTVLGVIVLVLAISAGLGALHVGVEQHFWPSPLPECNAPQLNFHSQAQLLNSLRARPSKPCDAPSYLVPGLPLSMAAMNLIYSLVILALLANYLATSREPSR